MKRDEQHRTRILRRPLVQQKQGIINQVFALVKNTHEADPLTRHN